MCLGMKIFTLSSLLLASFFCSVAQNELYNNGDVIYVNGQAGTLGAYATGVGNEPTLYVKGEINNNSGTFTNAAGEVQLTGNLTNNGTFTSTGDEIFVDNNTQRISGDFAVPNGLFNMIVAKGANTIVELNTDVHAENEIEFNSGGRVRTDVSGHADDGSAYAHMLYMRNTTPSQMNGYNWPTGSDKYVEGKLKRDIIAGNPYPYPIGVAPGNIDDMEPALLDFATAPSNGVLGYLQPGALSLINTNVYSDFGRDPGAGLDNIADCIGGPDGVLDWASLDDPQSHEWVFTPDNTAGPYDYNITVYPGSVLDATANYPTCAASGISIRYLSKSYPAGGTPGGLDPSSVAASPTGVIHIPAGTGFYANPTGNTLIGMTSFSQFRIFGTTPSSTALPVELISLNANPVDNEYIRVDWATAVEINNAGFDVYRSDDGINFEQITWVEGHGNTTTVSNYVYDDKNVVANKMYYYKLKQQDLNGDFSWTYIVAAMITNDGSLFSVSDFFPNPTTHNSSVVVNSTTEKEITITMVDNLGRVVMDKTVNIFPGQSTIDFESQNYADGAYFAFFTSDNFKATKKLVVSKF